MSVTAQNLKPGTKVTYYNHPDSEPEIGIVKRLNPNSPNTVFIVYHWADDEKKYADFTAASTSFRNLKLGW